MHAPRTAARAATRGPANDAATPLPRADGSVPAPPLPPPLLASATRLRRRPGEAVFHAGDSARAIFYVESGTVRLMRHGPGGEAVTLHDAHAGDFFAEASLDSDRYHCDARAVEPSTLLQLPAVEFRALLDTDPAFARRWIALLTAQLRATRARVERLSIRGAADRVRHLLLTQGTGPRSEYRPPGSLRGLALALGLSHEALYRTLARMERAGELERDGAILCLPGRPSVADTPANRARR